MDPRQPTKDRHAIKAVPFGTRVVGLGTVRELERAVSGSAYISEESAPHRTRGDTARSSADFMPPAEQRKGPRLPRDPVLRSLTVGTRAKRFSGRGQAA